MANAFADRIGQINNAGDATALFLKVYAGEVLVSFRQTTATLNRHVVRTIVSGKSAQFPLTGRTDAVYHTPGAEILGQDIANSERVISIDDLLLSNSFIASIDDAMNHYDVSSIYAQEAGVALANQMDKHVFQTMLQAAADTSPQPSTEGDRVGTIIENSDLPGTSPDMSVNADDLIAAAFQGAQALDENNVPEENRTLYLKPAHYYLLANSSKVINGDFGNAGNGSTSKGRVFWVAGLEVVKSNNLPTANVTGGAGGGTGNRHAVDARNTIGVVSHMSSVGTVKLMDLATEMEYDIRRQGTLMVAKYAMGHGILRPESVVQLRTVTPS
jgi:hypothetical protein